MEWNACLVTMCKYINTVLCMQTRDHTWAMSPHLYLNHECLDMDGVPTFSYEFSSEKKSNDAWMYEPFLSQTWIASFVDLDEGDEDNDVNSCVLCHVWFIYDIYVPTICRMCSFRFCRWKGKAVVVLFAHKRHERCKAFGGIVCLHKPSPNSITESGPGLHSGSMDFYISCFSCNWNLLWTCR